MEGQAMSDTVEIGYVSATDQEYSKALGEVKTLDDLKKLVNYYEPVARDAVAKVNGMSSYDFVMFKEDSRKVKRATGKEAERIVDEWGDIFMPRTMMKVSLTAIQFGAPFGTAFIRLKEMGKLYE
jgi:hypothetical protein